VPAKAKGNVIQPYSALLCWSSHEIRQCNGDGSEFPDGMKHSEFDKLGYHTQGLLRALYKAVVHQAHRRNSIDIINPMIFTILDAYARQPMAHYLLLSPSNTPHEVLAKMPPSSAFANSVVPSLSALRFLFSSRRFLRSARIFICLFSTPVNQYPKLPPAAAKTGYAQSDSLLKKGRISMPSCQKRTARPVGCAKTISWGCDRREPRGWIYRSRSRRESYEPLRVLVESLRKGVDCKRSPYQ